MSNGMVRFTKGSLSSGVTNVTASAPISSSGGQTPDISMLEASAVEDGYLSQKDWNTFNDKSYAMSGNLLGTKISVGTFHIGIGATQSFAQENQASVVVAVGTVTYIYLRIVKGAMTGSMVVTLMKNGVATAMTFSIPVSSPAGMYSTAANQVDVDTGDLLSFKIVQTTAQSCEVFGFGFIIQ